MFSVKKLYNIKLPTQRKVKFGPVRIFLIDDSEIILVQDTVSENHQTLVFFTNQLCGPLTSSVGESEAVRAGTFWFGAGAGIKARLRLPALGSRLRLHIR